MRTLYSLLLLGVLALSGCDGNPTNTNTNTNNSNTTSNSNSTVSLAPPVIIKPDPKSFDPNFVSCNPYFPLVPGSQAKFLLQLSSSLVCDVNVVVDRAEEDGKTVFVEKTQIIDKSGGFYKNELTTRKYACDNGRILLLSEVSDSRTEKNSSIMNMEFRGLTVAFPDAASLARKGTSWSYSFTPVGSLPDTPRIEMEPQFIRFDVLGPEKVKVPAGEFNAVKVQRKIKEVVVLDYYVPGLGLVKRTTNEGSFWELKEYSGLTEVK